MTIFDPPQGEHVAFREVQVRYTERTALCRVNTGDHGRHPSIRPRKLLIPQSLRLAGGECSKSSTLNIKKKELADMDEEVRLATDGREPRVAGLAIVVLVTDPRARMSPLTRHSGASWLFKAAGPESAIVVLLPNLTIAPRAVVIRSRQELFQ
jgi:hypothetical protein